MKIAIPVENKTLEANVSTVFGRANYFLIYDTEREESVFVDNLAQSSAGGAGIKAAQTVVDQKVNALLTPRLGENAADILEAAGIKIYQAINASARKNIDAFGDGKLSLLDEVHAGFHEHGDN
ncbi:MAG: dinitrogenase iron-molybdenum cofactor biosynthesis protein [Clostridiaceae bacterium]|jgi:predicted Fe-Mo cluster-binding NifX family protein|nr:dinitrogenase iron-molybdenum cofactor biosynthesis protein [Clostridiaceae bacterium]